MKVLVTGASGYLASWIVRLLLERGIQVHGTVRDLANSSKVAHLLAMQQEFPAFLQLFQADLLQPGQFFEAMQGCDVVIHTASPYFLQPSDNPMRDLVDPALLGTQSVLESVNQTPSVQKVVLTSSVVTLYNDACDHAGPISERDHNARCTLSNAPYAYSKTLAEERAVEMAAQQERWQLVTIHPGAMFGPSLSQRCDATSVGMVIQFLNGAFKQGVPQLTLGVVDVRDVAEAHILAALKPDAQGKYVVVAESLRLLEIAHSLQRVATKPLQHLPKKEVPKALIWLIAPWIGMTRHYVAKNVAYPLQFNRQRSEQGLGLSYRLPQVTFKDHLQQIEADQLLERA